jgi:hypothetical protein
MVRQTKFSFDEEMQVSYPEPEDDFDDDFDDLVTDRVRPVKSPSSPRKPRRDHPGDRRPDRRHLADADWLKNSSPEERRGESGDSSAAPSSAPQSASP